MTVHNHDLDPGCREFVFGGSLLGECALRAGSLVLSEEDLRATLPPTFSENLNLTLAEIGQMMSDRHEKHGPGNIAEFGDVGILVRLSDKFARLKNGRENFDDETVENTLDDIIGYALIWKLWIRKQWPGSVASGDSN